jgi:hypothetical protein
MPTYPPPIPLTDLQRFLKDSSTDPNVVALLTEAINVATERVYTYLDRDYTANAAKLDVFLGNDRAYRFLRHPAGVLTSWKHYDAGGVETDVGASSLKLFANGKLVVSKEKTFLSGYEHRIGYTTPASLICPEMVRQVILEIAADMFEESKQGAGEFGIARDAQLEYLPLAERHLYMLAPYRRVPL